MTEKTTQARPYAKAVFEYALDAGTLSTWSEFLKEYAVVMAHPTMQELVRSPDVSDEQLFELLLEFSKIELGVPMQNFFWQLIHNKRLLLLPEIAGLFKTYLAEHEKTVDVNVISAFPVSEDLQAKLATAMRKRLDRDVQIHCSVDNSLIGGAIIRAGDLVIDGSMRNKLKNLHDSMIA